MEKEKICGIYCIKNLINGKRYIGSSCDIYSRWYVHKNMLNKNKHYNEHLQRTWNKYKKNNFMFLIIEKCTRESLFNREQYWIDKLQVIDDLYGYNKAPVAGVANMGNATHKQLIDGKFSITENQFNDVISYLENTDISIVKIADITNVSKHTIYKIYSKSIYNDLVKNIDFIPRKVNCEYNGHTVISRSDAENVISLLLSGKTVYEIVKCTGIKRQTISDIKNKHSWVELTKDIIFPKPKTKRPTKLRKISQFTKDGIFIKTFDSFSDAVKELDLPTMSGLYQCCAGNQKTAYGYTWKFA